MNITKTALKFGNEAFQNALEQVAVLNPGVCLRTQGANINRNALSGVLVKYNADRSKHEVQLVPGVVDEPEVERSPAA